MFKSLSLAVLVVSLAALSGCASTQATTSDEQLEPNAILAHRNLNGEWEVTANFAAVDDNPPVTAVFSVFMNDLGRNRFIGAVLDRTTAGTNILAGEKSVNDLTMYLSGTKYIGSFTGRNSVSGTLTVTSSGRTGTWSMTRIR